MRTLVFAGLVVAVGVLTMSAVTTFAAPKAAPVLKHIVLYKFKDGLAPEKIQEVVDAFSELPSKIDTIVGFEHGTNVSPEGKSDGLTHAFVVSFRTEADRDAYLTHPAHLEYVSIVKDRREKVIVFDYWDGDVAPRD